MLLAQRIYYDMTDNGETKKLERNVLLKITDKVYKNMKVLIKDMNKHPQNFNEEAEYTLIEPRSFVKVTYPKLVKIEIVDALKTPCITSSETKPFEPVYIPLRGDK